MMILFACIILSALLSDSSFRGEGAEVPRRQLQWSLVQPDTEVDTDDSLVIEDTQESQNDVPRVFHSTPMVRAPICSRFSYVTHSRNGAY